MFAPEELADFNRVARDGLPGRCDITRKTRVRNPNGSWRDVVATVASNMPCRKVPTGQTPEERAILAGTALGSRGVATFIMEGVQEVFKDDVIKYPTGVGKDFGVIGVLNRTDGEYVRAMVYDDSAAPVVAP